MKEIDYFKLFVWLGLLAFCVAFWLYAFASGSLIQILIGLIVVFGLIFLTERSKYGKY